MNWRLKVVLGCACLILLCTSLSLWSIEQNAADQKKLALEAKQARIRAEHGDAKAQDDLALMYYYGKGVPQNYVEAVRWWRKAAEQGDAKGQYNLGRMYHDGKGVPHDDAEAARWYRKAADQGAAIGEDALGTAYYYGDGVPQDFRAALLWFRKAADQGYADAQNSIGLMYYNGRGILRDYNEAAAWFRKASEQGYADAQYNLGYAYSKGRGVVQDDRQAAAWIRKAADQNYAKAQQELGYMYFYGKGVDENYVQAADWYRKAAEQGYALAQFDLGLMYLDGYGVPQDRAEADRWFRKAAAQGNASAKRKLSEAPPGANKVRNLWLLIAFLGAIWIGTEFLLRRGWVQLYTLRRYAGLLFAATACIFLVIAFPRLQRTTGPHGKLGFFFVSLLPTMVLVALAAVLAVASWITLSGKRSARGWGIAASLIFLLAPIWPTIFSSQLPWRGFGSILVVGVVGLVAFSHRLARSDDRERLLEDTQNPGDGTSVLFNVINGFLLILAIVLSDYWWRSWVRTNGIPVVRGGWSYTLMWVLVVVLILILHELGHTVAGLGLGMKLRGFVVGPLQWYFREGRWEFQFKLTSILGGQTLLVPTSVDFPRWRELTMGAAGALANVSTGLLALWVAMSPKAHGWQYARGALGLFGAWSIIVGLGNLLPFRIPDSYSDGAQIYQILSKGPWRDFHRAVLISASTLVTSLRPRDYDIQTIQRAAQGITRGLPAMSLRLLAYSYFFDNDQLSQAREAFKESGSICEQCALSVPAELLTEFVFGSAYVLRDAAVARRWWTLMLAKKPARFNVDYWKAASALHWIEGNLNEANVAWEKCNLLAQKLPSAGAYEFDRDCCSRLRQAIDEATIAKAAETM